MTQTIDQCILDLRSKYRIVDVIDTAEYDTCSTDLYQRIFKNYRHSYQNNERIVFVVTKDYYKKNSQHGIMLQTLQTMINDIDISNYFVCVITTNTQVQQEYEFVIKNISSDSVPFKLYVCQGEFETVQDTTQQPYIKYSKINNPEHLENLTKEQKYLLFESKSFCMMPWVSLMLSPNSAVKPCCESTLILGDCSKQSLEEIWNSPEARQMRQQMLADTAIPSCNACYRKESLGRDTLRKSINRRFLQQIFLVDRTQPDGFLDQFQLKYLDARFNNLCNLACRSCDSGSSSSWHAPAVYLGLKDKNSKPLLVAGKNEIDILDQLKTHVGSLERIYFAGGEPLMIEQFYNLVEYLDQQGQHNVELLYNTNMTKSSFKQKSIFDLWRNFKNISVGASLDAEGSRGEYLRAGCDWNSIVEFRQQMIQQRPDIDFYISATTSIVNALHLPDFHKSWTDQGLIAAKDFNIQMLFGPAYLRLDRAPNNLKTQIRERYKLHLQWLRPRDPIGRAVSGFESVLAFMDNSEEFDAQEFWSNIEPLDRYYQTDLLRTFPELADLPRRHNGI